MADKMAFDRAKKAALGKALRAMFKRLQARPVPDRLTTAVDQLEAAAAKPPRKKTG